MTRTQAFPSIRFLLITALVLVASTVVILHRPGTIIPKEAIEAIERQGDKVQIVVIRESAQVRAEPAQPPQSGQQPEKCYTGDARLGSLQIFEKVNQGFTKFRLTSMFDTTTLVQYAGDIVHFAQITKGSITYASMPTEFFEEAMRTYAGNRVQSKISTILYRAEFGPTHMKYSPDVSHPTRAELTQKMGWNGECQ